MGCQEVEKELADLWGYVKQLEEKLHKEGNQHVAKVTRYDNTNIHEQELKVKPIWNVTLAAHGAVKSLMPVPIPPLIHLMNNQDINQDVNQNANHCHPNPWAAFCDNGAAIFDLAFALHTLICNHKQGLYSVHYPSTMSNVCDRPCVFLTFVP